jgi:hypothetical protein
MDVMQLHEKYQPPIVGVGEPVLIRFKNRNCFVAGYVQPPQIITWKPGDQLGKRISVYCPSMNRVIEDIVHIGDPLHTQSPEIYSTVWECCTPGKVINVQGAIVEMQARLAQLVAELKVVEEGNREHQREIGKLKAAKSFGKKDKEPELSVA